LNQFQPKPVFFDGEGISYISYSSDMSYFITCGVEAIAPLNQPAIGITYFQEETCDTLVSGSSTLLSFNDFSGTSCFSFPYLDDAFRLQSNGKIEAFCSDCESTDCSLNLNATNLPECLDSFSLSSFGALTWTWTEVTSDSTSQIETTENVEETSENTNVVTSTEVSENTNFETSENNTNVEETSENTNVESSTEEDSSSMHLLPISILTLWIFQ